jgi:hypothetical protein
MNAPDLTDRRQKMWRGLERQSGHFNKLGAACFLMGRLRASDEKERN